MIFFTQENTFAFYSMHDLMVTVLINMKVIFYLFYRKITLRRRFGVNN